MEIVFYFYICACHLLMQFNERLWIVFTYTCGYIPPKNWSKISFSYKHNCDTATYTHLFIGPQNPVAFTTSKSFNQLTFCSCVVCVYIIKLERPSTEWMNLYNIYMWLCVALNYYNILICNRVANRKTKVKVNRLHRFWPRHASAHPLNETCLRSVDLIWFHFLLHSIRKKMHAFGFFIYNSECMF